MVKPKNMSEKSSFVPYQNDRKQFLFQIFFAFYLKNNLELNIATVYDLVFWYIRDRSFYFCIFHMLLQ